MKSACSYRSSPAADRGRRPRGAGRSPVTGRLPPCHLAPRHGHPRVVFASHGQDRAGRRGEGRPRIVCGPCRPSSRPGRGFPATTRGATTGGSRPRSGGAASPPGPRRPSERPRTRRGSRPARRLRRRRTPAAAAAPPPGQQGARPALVRRVCGRGGAARCCGSAGAQRGAAPAADVDPVASRVERDASATHVPVGHEERRLQRDVPPVLQHFRARELRRPGPPARRRRR